MVVNVHVVVESMTGGMLVPGVVLLATLHATLVLVHMAYIAIIIVGYSMGVILYMVDIDMVDMVDMVD